MRAARVLEWSPSVSEPKGASGVDDLFNPPGASWERVSPDLARVRRALLVAGWLVLAGLWGVVVAVLDLPWWTFALAVLFLVVTAVVGWRWIGRVVARWGYLEREDDLCITHGALLRRMVVVPYGRMQYVDVQAGPLAQTFGYARIQLHTASPATSASLPGLPAAEATRLRDRLTSLGEAQAAGL